MPLLSTLLQHHRSLRPAPGARSIHVALVGVAVALLALASCSRENTGAGAQEAKAQGAAPAPVPVTVVEMQPQRVPIVLEAVGQTEGSKAVEVRARVGGILLKQLYQEGDPVHAGVRMFEIDPAPFQNALQQAEAQVAQDQAHIEQYQRDVERLRPLAQDRAVSQKEYDDSRSNLQLAHASLQQSQAKVRDAELNLSYTVVTAPVSGVTGRAEKTIGNLITTDAAGSLLTTINQLDPMWVSFALSQSDLARLPGGRLDKTTGSNVSLVLGEGKVYPTRGHINFAATQIDPRLGTQQLRASFANPGQDLLPGQFVRVRIAAGERDNAFLVPQTAVIQTEKNYLVFVVQDSKAVARPVKTGDWYGTSWIILSGLSAGDKVIVDNLVKLRPGVAVNAQLAANNAAGGGTPAGTGDRSTSTAGTGAPATPGASTQGRPATGAATPGMSTQPGARAGREPATTAPNATPPASGGSSSSAPTK